MPRAAKGAELGLNAEECAADRLARRRGRAGGRWVRLAVVAVALQLVPALPLAWAEAPAVIRAGLSLTDALRLLESSGLTIVFTSELVRSEMKVAVEPTASSPRGVLSELLAPHGLSYREDDGVLVVVALPVERTIEGVVREAVSDRPLAGAVVEVLGVARWGEASPDGFFSISLPPGRYSLEARIEGYLAQRLDLDLALAAEPLRLEFRLQRQPFVHEEIVVRPSRLSLLLEQPNTTFSLGRDEIDAMPQLGGDLFRTAALFPGVTANDVSAQFSVHGGRRDEVRVVLDGQELYDAYHLKDYDNALSLVPARTLADAQLTTGSYPVHHGDRMSAVLDLRTIDPPSGRHVVIGLSFLDVLLSASGRFAGERAGWLVTARRGSLDLAADAIGDESPHFWDLQAKLERSTGNGSFSGHLLASKDELEVDDADEEGFEIFDNGYENAYAWVNHQAAISRRLLVSTIGSVARVRRDRGGQVVEEEGGFALSDKRELDVLSLSQTWTLDGGDRHAVQWGVEGRRYDAFFDYAKDLEPEFLVLAPFAPGRQVVHAFEGDLLGEHVGVWASDRWSLSDRLTAEIGLRFDDHQLTGDRLWSPRLNLAWRRGQRTVLRAAWGVFHQTQRPYELQVEDGENRLAEAERSEHWLLGSESVLPANRWGLEALRIELYRREIENPRTRYESLLEPLNFFPEIEPDRVRIDPSRARAEGVELLLRGRGGERLSWWLAYSVARAEDRLLGEWTARSLDQRHTTTLDVNYRMGRWNLNAAWRYHTGWPTTPVETLLVSDPEEPDEEPEVVPVFGPLNSERFPAYHRLDLRASRSWSRDSGLWTFFVDIQNLYGRRNLAGFDVALDEETGTVLLEREDWPGVFPSVGLTWAFPVRDATR